jgi:delta(3,5)-delta(2,4)-dienoyl-CoA isomerase
VVERARVPVICAMSGYVIGAGVDLSSACDIRVCSKDAQFSIREIEIGMCADLGTIQRFQKVVGSSTFFRELAFTGRFFGADEALKHGYVSYVTDTREDCISKAMELARNIASKSPVGMTTLK